MTVLVDPPEAQGHGRLWSHVASDESFDELHAFARRLGIPERGFDRDHYDLPAEWYSRAVEAGATPVTSRELITRLKESFDFCETALAKVDDSNLTAQVPWFGDRKVSRAHVMLAAAEDWADHYSQLAIYLRLNGKLPPTAKGKQEE